MPTSTVDVRELSTRFAELLSSGTAGSEIILSDNDVPVAKLVPLVGQSVRHPGLHAGASTTTPDFDAPLSDSDWIDGE